ncbi:phage portal protein [Massilia soli]|uniref:Phage portal protein n=1 Tax=Massilia soli TaxID=2792854 RepID=A0ABS7SRC1_9BURK|nr:phage portal protein [Massilia soli]MBZ2208486.1 phage portal protein [Massilia soli]
MPGKLLNLKAIQHTSRVLGSWLSARNGGTERAGMVALGENSSGSLTMSELTNLLGAAHRSSSGAAVTADTAMRVSAAYACMSLVAGAIATLPIGIYERKGNERDSADHEYWWMLNEKASDGWTSSAAWESIILSKLSHGDGFGEWVRPRFSSNRVTGWKPLPRHTVQPFKDGDTVRYRITPGDKPSYVLAREDIIHLPSLGFDGLTSPSPLTYAAMEAIGTALSAQEHIGQFFSGGANFDYALKTDSKLDKTQLEQLKASLLARAQNGGRGPLILGGGLTPAQVSVNSKDAEILATRLFTVEEICRIFGVPPFMVGHTDKTTSWGSGVENMGIGFVRYTLQRHLTPIAQEVNSKLWPVRERFFVEHITAALERGDLKARYDAYRTALGRSGEMPFMTADEIRRRENMPPNTNLTMNGGTSAEQPDQAPGEQQEAA